MGIANVTENAILDLVFRATAWTDYAINHTTTPQTSISIGLHTADPGEAGTMATSESAYTNYARQSINRSGTSPNFAAADANGESFLAANVDFPSSGAAGTTITFFSTGHTGTVAQPILWSGDVSPSIAVGASGVIPRLTTATKVTLT